MFKLFSSVQVCFLISYRNRNNLWGYTHPYVCKYFYLFFVFFKFFKFQYVLLDIETTPRYLYLKTLLKPHFTSGSETTFPRFHEMGKKNADRRAGINKLSALVGIFSYKHTHTWWYGISNTPLIRIVDITQQVSGSRRVNSDGQRECQTTIKIS